jgi:hypothetical protein
MWGRVAGAKPKKASGASGGGGEGAAAAARNTAGATAAPAPPQPPAAAATPATAPTAAATTPPTLPPLPPPPPPPQPPARAFEGFTFASVGVPKLSWSILLKVVASVGGAGGAYTRPLYNPQLSCFISCPCHHQETTSYLSRASSQAVE